MSIETSITYTTSDGQSFDDRQEAETHEQWLADEPEAREADRQRGWTDYTPPQPEWKPEPKPATPDITDHDGPRSVSEADWLEVNLPDLTVGASVLSAEMIASGMAT